MTQTRLVIDSDVFIAATRTYYHFEICPGFWTGMAHHQSISPICSIDKVLEEITRPYPPDELAIWARNQISPTFFCSTNEEQIQESYAQIIEWINSQHQYTRGALVKFTTGADGWLIAYSMVHSGCIVTNERSHPDSKNRIFIPDVCRHFQLPVMDTFGMLRQLGIQFTFTSE